MLNIRLKNSLLLFGTVLMFSSCVSVKAYQRMYLNDEDMKTAMKKMEAFEVSFESYREGPSGASGGKSGGGCGCN
jgi:hypothetical protein